MIAFAVELNGTPLCTAGIGDTGVLTTILTWVKRKTDRSDELTLEVGGLGHEPEGDVHLKWVNRQLRVGIVLCEGDPSERGGRPEGPPARRSRARGRGEAPDYERLKREYGE